MNLLFQKTTWLLCLALVALGAQAGPLDKSAPEYQQLLAMGYEIDPPSAGETSSIARSPTANIIVSKYESGMSFARYFTRSKKKLDDAQMLKLLTTINQVNIDLSIQIALTDQYLACAVYHHGPYNTRSFAGGVRQIEMCSTIFDRYPDLLKFL